MTLPTDIAFHWQAYLCRLGDTTPLGAAWVASWVDRRPGITNSYVGPVLTLSLCRYSALATEARRSGLTVTLNGKRGTCPSTHK